VEKGEQSIPPEVITAVRAAVDDLPHLWETSAIRTSRAAVSGGVGHFESTIIELNIELNRPEDLHG
jgi:hypothetical protein